MEYVPTNPYLLLNSESFADGNAPNVLNVIALKGRVFFAIKSAQCEDAFSTIFDPDQAEDLGRTLVKVAELARQKQLGGNHEFS